MQTGCNEGANGGRGFLLAAAPGASPRVVELDTGRVAVLRNHVLVESRLQFASDMSDDGPDPLPRGATGTWHDGNGSFYVSRLLAVDTRTLRVRDAGWDTFGAATAGDQRCVVVARNHRADGPPTMAEDYLVWNLDTGRLRPLGSSGERVQYCGSPAVRSALRPRT